MKLKLIVLAGAKEGLEIPLRKDKFLIGRAKECALRAGSEAISRRHCAIIRREAGWTVRDLGSRNGTHVNDEKITAEVPLKAGDELRVGPLKFRVAERESSSAPASILPENPAVPTLAEKPKRQPPVKDVADVVERTISNSDSTSEDDVSRWLIDLGEDVTDMLKETRSLRAEDTSINRITMAGDNASTVEDVSQIADEAMTDTAQAGAKDEASSGVWKFLKRGKAGAPAPKKKEPGKLPPREEQKSKDSRDAAADILREMQRRR